MSAPEWIAAVFTVAYIILAARNIIWCWPLGIIGSVIYVYLNFGWQLYYDMVLQAFYVLAGFYGWWKWAKGDNGQPEQIINWGFVQQWPLLLLGAMLSVGLGFLTYYTIVPVPITFFDATVTVFSFMATYMTAKKIIEGWLWWIVIDIAAIYLYWLKESPITSGVYLVLTLGAAYAYLQWKKEIKLAHR